MGSNLRAIFHMSDHRHTVRDFLRASEALRQETDLSVEEEQALKDMLTRLAEQVLMSERESSP